MVLFTVDHSNHSKNNTFKDFNVPFPHLAKCSKHGVLFTVLPFIRCCLGPFTRALSWFVWPAHFPHKLDQLYKM